MQDDPYVENHRSVEYRVFEVDEGTSSTCSIRWSDDGRSVQIIAICPNCGGKTSTEWEFGAPSGYKAIGIRGTRKRDRPQGLRTICCQCGHSHPNRPEDDVFVGCGAYWQVELD